MIGLIGKKIGMTRVFHKDGASTPITVLEIKKHYVTQIKNTVNDYYHAIQVTTGIKKKKKLVKSEIGHFAKSGVLVGCGLWEFRIHENEVFQLGQIIDISFFNTIHQVDVSGITKGKGFSGTVKRWNFSMQDATHGNSLSHRAPGSIGQNQTPGRVFKGKKMSGQLGNTRVTIQNLKVIKIDFQNNLMFVKGSVPGSIGGNVIVKPAIKA
ncbi:50S ribosomal protein L3 [Buchnera aphidicola (Takecallis taiwana)]|uniref:50S ribosomal protein L3 n=1 Tax=Buchnera aphidicola TaxID=9 RepID=UPI0031B70EF9